MRPLAQFAASLLASAAVVAQAALLASAAQAAPPAYIAAAVANPDRPDADKARDEARKPAEVIAYSWMKPGWKVADFIAATGYYSRIFSGVVGPKGHVYAYYPTELKNFAKSSLPPDGATPWPKFANVTAVVTPVNAFRAPEKLDMVWLSDNYHDMHDPFFAPADLAKVNRAVFQALKPGGLYLVLDHAATPHTGLRDTNTLHRIDKNSVIDEVEAAGFTLVGESKALRNPADTHGLAIFDPSLRGHTDQFVLLFRRPVE
jgi:predicted methyltransferase